MSFFRSLQWRETYLFGGSGAAVLGRTSPDGFLSHGRTAPSERTCCLLVCYSFNYCLIEGPSSDCQTVIRLIRSNYHFPLDFWQIAPTVTRPPIPPNSKIIKTNRCLSSRGGRIFGMRRASCRRRRSA